jgi:hypothetical protein
LRLTSLTGSKDLFSCSDKQGPRLPTNIDPEVLRPLQTGTLRELRV